MKGSEGHFELSSLQNFNSPAADGKTILEQEFWSRKVLFLMTKRISMLVATSIKKIIAGSGNKNPYSREARSLQPIGVTAYAGLASKCIFFTFIQSPTITRDVYVNSLKSEIFPWA